MEFLCVKALDGPGGEHWVEGDTYTLTRRDVMTLHDGKLLKSFAPAGKDGEELLKELESRNAK